MQVLVSFAAAAALVLKHEAISMHSTDLMSILAQWFHKKWLPWT